MGDLTTGTARHVAVNCNIHSCAEHLEKVKDGSFKEFTICVPYRCKKCKKLLFRHPQTRKRVFYGDQLGQEVSQDYK